MSHEPAFPLVTPRMGVHDVCSGMSLRDWFAGQFLANVEDQNLDIRKGETVQDARRRYWAEVAETAYIAADEFLEARK